MATETLYATSLTSGTVSTSGNALGAPDGTFTDDVDNVSWTARFAMGNPTGNTANGTHSVTLRVRKETGTGTPVVNSITLYAGTTSLGTIGAGNWSVTSTTGEDIQATFADTVIDGNDLSTIEVEVVTTASGGGPSVRSCVQLDGITWTGDFTTSGTAHSQSPTDALALSDGATQDLARTQDSADPLGVADALVLDRDQAHADDPGLTDSTTVAQPSKWSYAAAVRVG